MTRAPGREDWKVTVIVPTLDEEEAIASVLVGVRPYADELIVVDGGSRDRTREIAAGLGVRVVRDGEKGKGSAIRHALDVASHAVVVFVDGDGSHEPTDIPRLVAPIVRDEADIVIGSRMTGGSDELFSDFPEFIRLTGSMIINLAINYRWNVRLSDSQNGFRALSLEVVRALGLREDSTTIEQEMVMKALAAGHRVLNVPSHEYRRQGGRSKVVVSRVWPRYVWNVLKHVLDPRGALLRRGRTDAGHRR